MKCDLCSEKNVGPDHEISEKHLKNQVLYEYSVNRKQFAGNRKGAVVTCTAKSSFVGIDNSTDAKIKISAKPNEEIQFNFTISNESKKENMNINFVQIPQNKLNFTMSNHNITFGSALVTLRAKEVFSNKIYVKFLSPHIGQYEMPIIFSFFKTSTNENIVIVRHMIVYVEQKQAMHHKVISPYTRKEVTAMELVKTSSKGRECDNLFRIPKNYKPVYANNLKVKDDASEADKALTADILEIFETGITKDNYVRFFHNLLWYEETIVRINLKKYNMSGVELIHSGGDFLNLFVPGLGEKRPSLMLGDLLFIKPHLTNEVMFEAVISDINENYISIRGLHERFWKLYNRSARFDVRFFMSRMPLERMHQAVSSVLSGHEARVFPVENKKLPQILPILKYFNLSVQSNPEQRLAVEHMVAGSMGAAPYLLHGPPGTGKTVTIVEAILQLVNKSPSNKIMVCTDSNMAADHVATMLTKYQHMFSTDKLLLRANSKYRVWETLPKCLHPYSNGTSYSDFEPVSIDDFMAHRIVVTTLSHAAKFARQFQLKKLKRPITHLFIDEAAQASEPACLVPCAGLLAPAGALLLAGDPLQLGPVVISRAAAQRGLELSLMERLKKTCPLYSDERRDPNYMVMLVNNFRSHEDILHLPNKLFYNGQLRVLAAEDEISRTDILGEKNESRAIVFHGVLSKEQKVGRSPSFYNDMEAEIVQMYVRFLIDDHHVLPEDIGIVAPYIRQVYKLKAWLKNNDLERVEVGTVEAFQGKEKRVIIITTVRANCGLLDHDAKFQLGFLVDDKRFNVALTRAKAKAIVIGNPLCLEKDVKWLAYMQQCRQFGTYFGFDSAALQPDLTQKELLDRITPMLKDLKISDKPVKGRV